MERACLGIDIAKASFDVALLTPKGPRHHRFDNQLSGFQALLAWLERQGSGPCHACLEATGTYGVALATFLHAQGLQVSVVNPKRIAHFAKSRLSRAKTDKVDAALIADFCRQENPAPWSPPAPEYQHLQALLRHREALERLRQQERNRLGAAAHPAYIRNSLQAHVEYLTTEITAVEAAMRDHCAAHPELARQRELLESIPGIGETTAHWLLGELGGIERCGSARQVAAFAGLDPRVEPSGTWKGKARLSKQGNSHLRKALYYPALAALRHNPVLREFAARLRERGKSGMAVVGAVMRKLLHLAYGVLRHGKAFDPEWGHR